MKILKGITASAGLARGAACLYPDKAEDDISHYIIGKEKVESEILRLKEARNNTIDVMKHIIHSSKGLYDKSASEIFDAHLAILKDPVLYNRMAHLIKSRLINAEHAANDVFEEYIKAYKRNKLHFRELSHDIIDVRNRFLSSFSGISAGFECAECQRRPVVIVSERLLPSMILSISKQNVLAFVTKEGGYTTHATILARSYGVPIVFGIEVGKNINCGDRLIVDGSNARIYIRPDKETDKRYLSKIKEIEQKKTICAIRKEEPPQTNRGVRIKLKVNISVLGEMELLNGCNYDGIGLLRTEFLFPNKEYPPSEEEQLNMYRYIFKKAQGREVVIRLLDIGRDKIPNYIHLPAQENPDLGIRGARALDFSYDIYLTQAKAILRASLYGDLKILYPMVSDVNDINSFKNLLSRAKSILKREGKRFKGDLKQGIMIETPSAAIMSRSLLKYVDFANIGSNDLLQYTLAASRGNTFSEKRYHILHPSLTRLIEMIIEAGKYNRKELCLCGEIASFEGFYPLFISLGLRSFSVSPAKLADIKCELLHQSSYDKSLLRKFYQTETKEDIDRLFS